MSREFSFIKPFRAIAAFWVLSGHVFQWWGAYTPAYFPPPKLAVDLFMIISGYLMAANAFARASSEPMSQSRNWARFWLRRYFRVAPAYYLSLALVVLLLSVPFLEGYQNLIHMFYGNALVGTDYDPATIQYTPLNILLHLSFLFGLFPAYASSTYLPDWSLSLEMQFYLVFPLLFLILRRFNFIVTAALIGFVSFAFGLALSKYVHFPEPSPLVMKLNCFIAGMVLYHFLAGGVSKMQSVATALLALALVSIDYRYHAYLLVLPVLMGLMLLLGWLELHGKMPKWLSALIEGRLVQFASDTSYGVYLFHGFFIAIVGLLLAGNEGFIASNARLFNWLMLGFVAVGSYMLSSIVYRLVELPGIQLGKRVIARLLPRAGGGSAPRNQDAALSAPAAGQ